MGIAAALAALVPAAAFAHPYGGEHVHDPQQDTEQIDTSGAPQADARPPAEPLVVADVEQCEDALVVDGVVLCDDELEPTPTPTAAEILGQTGADAVQWEPPRTPRFMSSEGIVDPFPDTVRRARPRDAGILLGLGVGFAVASAITARATLLPDCEDENELGTCTVPNGASIGLRSGRLFGTIGFSVGSAAFGAFGGRELGMLLQDSRRLSLERRRAVAVGLGSSAVVAGVTGLVVGSTLLGRGSRRSLEMAAGFDDSVSIDDPAERAQIDAALHQVKVARVGLMVLVASPVFLATGASLLANRPRRTRRVSVTPTASLTEVGVRATIHF